jgi:hypothetical protein
VTPLWTATKDTTQYDRLAILAAVQEEDTDTIQREPSAPFSNDDLCYFELHLSAPPKIEVEHLLRRAYEDQKFPSGSNITEAIRSLYVSPEGGQRPAQYNTVIAFADGGAACSIIRPDVVEEPGLTRSKAGTPMVIDDINAGEAVHDNITYVQVDIPGLQYRHLVLCLIMDTLDAPILIGSADQRNMKIIPQADTRTIRIGPAKDSLAHIPFMKRSDMKENHVHWREPVDSSDNESEHTAGSEAE